MKQVLASADFTPPDLITHKTVVNRKVRYRRLAFAVIGVSSLVLCVWKRDYVIEIAPPLVRRVITVYNDFL